ncbi:MAG: hypothetical protein LBE11_01255 [Prevotellaceae bacterium]|nr:hypothetical protein [Prevotellaceae bacterium]
MNTFMYHHRPIFCTCYLLLLMSVTSKDPSISGVVTNCADKQPLANVTEGSQPVICATATKSTAVTCKYWRCKKILITKQYKTV